MIRLYFGNLGSGKTLNAIKYMWENNDGRPCYTNIKLTQHVPWVHQIKPSDIIKKEIKETKVKRDGTTEVKYNLDLNIDHWLSLKGAKNIVWDEIHLTANSRDSQTKINRIFSRFLAMGRRFTGFDGGGYGTLTFIAQTPRTVEVNLRELANEIRHHRMHFMMTCKHCKQQVMWHSDREVYDRCFACGGGKFVRGMFISQSFSFNNFIAYLRFVELGERTYFETTADPLISDFFGVYDTHAVENLWENYLE